MMAENDEVVKLIDGAYKNILEKFNPSARQLISAGKAYLKALHGAVSASKAYIDALSKLARHAHQGTWGGCTDIGTALMQLVDVQKEIESQQLNILKAFYVDLLVPLESNIDKDTKIVACEHKRFLQQHKCLQESYLKAVASVKKQRKKSRNSREPNVDKEIKIIQALEEEKMKLDCFCERSLKQAIIQERRRFGFVLERQCSLTKHNMVYYSQGQNLLQHRLDEWEEVAKGREALPEPIDKLFPTANDFRACADYSTANVLNQSSMTLGGGGTLRKTRSIDTSCMDLREAPNLPFPGTLLRAKSDFNIASSSASLVSNDYGGQHMLPPRPKSLVGEDAVPERCKVRALYSYLSSGEHQLSFHEGDIIELIGSRNKGWQYGENKRNHRCGWFPIAYTEPVCDAMDNINYLDKSSSESQSSSADFSQPYHKIPVTRSKTAPSIHAYDCGTDSSYASAASSPLSGDCTLPPAPTMQRPFSTFVDSNRNYESLQMQQLRLGSTLLYSTTRPATYATPAATPTSPTGSGPLTSEHLPRHPMPPPSLHGSNDSGFCNDANGSIAPAKHTGTNYHSTGEPGDSFEEDDLKPKENIFSSVKLRKVITNDRSAPMIS